MKNKKRNNQNKKNSANNKQQDKKDRGPKTKESVIGNIQEDDPAHFQKNLQPRKELSLQNPFAVLAEEGEEGEIEHPLDKAEQSRLNILGQNAKVSLTIKNQTITPKEIQNILEWSFGEGLCPNWLFLKNKSLLKQICLVIFEGMNEEIFYDHKDMLDFLGNETDVRRFNCPSSPTCVYATIPEIFLGPGSKKKGATNPHEQKKSQLNNVTERHRQELTKLEELKELGQISASQKKKLAKLRSAVKKEDLYLTLAAPTISADQPTIEEGEIPIVEKKRKIEQPNFGTQNDTSQDSIQNNNSVASLENNNNSVASLENNNNSVASNNNSVASRENNNSVASRENNNNSVASLENNNNSVDHSENNSMESEDLGANYSTQKWNSKLNLIEKNPEKEQKYFADGFNFSVLVHSVQELEDAEFPMNLDVAKFFSFQKNDECQYHVVALDCEMCMTTNGLELTRITVISAANQSVIYESFCLTDNPIIDYLTKYSGITPEILKDVSTHLVDIQQDLSKLLSSDTIIVGHSLENDFQALKLVHHKVIDTALLYSRNNQQPLIRHSLKFLAQNVLKKSIQSRSSGHDSCEDALAALELARAFSAPEGENFRNGFLGKSVRELIVEKKGWTASVAAVGRPETVKKWAGRAGDVVVSTGGWEDIIERGRTSIQSTVTPRLVLMCPQPEQAANPEMVSQHMHQIHTFMPHHSILIGLSAISIFKPYGLLQILGKGNSENDQVEQKLVNEEKLPNNQQSTNNSVNNQQSTNNSVNNQQSTNNSVNNQQSTNNNSVNDRQSNNNSSNEEEISKSEQKPTDKKKTDKSSNAEEGAKRQIAELRKGIVWFAVKEPKE